MIRPVRPAEIAGLTDVAQRSYTHAFGDTYTPEELAKELSENRSEAYFRLAHERGDVLLVEVEDGQIRGFTHIRDCDLPGIDLQAGDQLLCKFYVDPLVQGQGIGRRLIEYTLSHPRLANAPRTYLQVRSTNHRAAKLYASLGFEIVGYTRLGVGNGQRDDDYIMMRPAKVPSYAD